MSDNTQASQPLPNGDPTANPDLNKIARWVAEVELIPPVLHLVAGGTLQNYTYHVYTVPGNERAAIEYHSETAADYFKKSSAPYSVFKYTMGCRPVFMEIERSVNANV